MESRQVSLIIVISPLLLMNWGSLAEPATLPTNMLLDKESLQGPLSGSSCWKGAGPPPKQPRQTLSHNPSGAYEAKLTNEMESSEDSSNLKWVSIKDKQIPSDAVNIFNDYTSRKDFVCRANDYCTFGFLNEGRGSLCFFPFRGYELHTDHFEVLVNTDNFERLEWMSGSKVPDPGIKFCQDNFVGKNEYGLGDIFKGYFYLPWEGKEIWYSSYDVLSVNRDIFDVHYSDVTYNVDLVNRTRHPPYTIKTFRVENRDSREVTETVHMEVTTVKANSWESTFSSSLAQSTSISAGIPDFGSASISIGAVVTLTLSEGHLESEAITQRQDVQVMVPPGYYCEVRMEGYKVEASMPYGGRVTKTYKDGKKMSTTVTGVYGGAQTSGIDSRVDPCQPLTTPAPALKLRVGSAATPWLVCLCFVCGVVILLSVLVFGVLCTRRQQYFRLREEAI
ncbi:natterin-3-like [Alosa alosa]|uniref:natterin-3-like n=1 Tax=Alosa alosa TaxID=278164 RepID=UPI0020152FDB|nr:natterin-3-like [Alosa alosa]